MNRAQLFWDKHAVSFDDADKRFEQANLELIALTREYLDTGDNVLDFGCAIGSKTLKLAEGVRHIHGLDFSGEMIREAIKRKEKSAVTNVSFSQGTIYDNDLVKASFDKITAFSIIHLLEESEKAIRRMHELLKPGGLLISETACFKEKMDFKTRLAFAPNFLKRRLGLFPLHLNMFKISDLEQLFTSQNFIITRSERIFFNGMTISVFVAKKI